MFRGQEADDLGASNEARSERNYRKTRKPTISAPATRFRQFRDRGCLETETETGREADDLRASNEAKLDSFGRQARKPTISAPATRLN